MNVLGPWESDQGASAAEYALLLAGIVAALVISLFVFGLVTTGTWTGACNSINVAGQGNC